MQHSGSIGDCGALRVAQALHVAMLACLLALAVQPAFWAFLALAGGRPWRRFCFYEHTLVKPNGPVARECGFLHHERLGERAILSLLGPPISPVPSGRLSHASHD